MSILSRVPAILAVKKLESINLWFGFVFLYLYKVVFRYLWTVSSDVTLEFTFSQTAVSQFTVWTMRENPFAPS